MGGNSEDLPAITNDFLFHFPILLNSPFLSATKYFKKRLIRIGEGKVEGRKKSISLGFAVP